MFLFDHLERLVVEINRMAHLMCHQRHPVLGQHRVNGGRAWSCSAAGIDHICGKHQGKCSVKGGVPCGWGAPVEGNGGALVDHMVDRNGLA